MPVIVGYLFGKMLGNLIGSIITLLFRMIRLVLILVGHVVRYAAIGGCWLMRKIWTGGMGLYEQYKLNYR